MRLDKQADNGALVTSGASNDYDCRGDAASGFPPIPRLERDMAQFDFLGTWVDSWAIISAILEPGDTSFIADLIYEKPQPLILRTLDEVSAHCRTGRAKLFLSSDLFSTHPPFMRKFNWLNDAERYRVSDVEGGPLLELLLPACYTQDDDGVPHVAYDGGTGLNLAGGMFHSQRQYQNPETQEWEWVSDKVKSGYKQILRRIKRQLVRHRFHQPIWIGKHGLREIQANNATIHGFGLD